VRKPVRTLGLTLWMALVIVWLGGFTINSIATLLSLLALYLLLSQVETRTRRPLRSYGRLLVASLFLFLVMVVGVAWSGGVVWLGAIFWLAISLMGAIWVVHYERTEPLA
jgi:hypothetical protein